MQQTEEYSPAILSLAEIDTQPDEPIDHFPVAGLHRPFETMARPLLYSQVCSTGGHTYSQVFWPLFRLRVIWAQGHVFIIWEGLGRGISLPSRQGYSNATKDPGVLGNTDATPALRLAGPKNPNSFLASL
jgi:hypothetical protein